MSNREQLFEKYIANRLSGDEKQALAELLNDDETIRADFVSYAADWALMASASRQSQRMSTETPAAKPASTIRFPILRRLPAMAAAAVILIAAGLFLLHRPPASDLPSFVTSVQKIGQVNVIGTQFATAAKSYCRVDMDNGTTLAMDQNTALSLARDAASGANLLTQSSGRLYMDVAKQKKPFIVHTGSATVEVLGTRLFMQPDQFVAVLSGTVGLQWDQLRVNLAQGQLATMEKSFGPGNGRIRVTRKSFHANELDWMSPLNIDWAKAVGDITAAPLRTIGNQMDLDSYILQMEGDWTIDRKDSSVMLRQNDPRATASIEFGNRKWKKGVVSYRFRVLQHRSDKLGVGVSFGHAEGMDAFLVSQTLKDWLGKYEWIAVRAAFDIGDANNLVATQEYWPVDRPDLKGSTRMEKTPANSDMIKKRDACRIGLTTVGCAVEIKDLQLTEAAATPGFGQPVHPDLIALWSFYKGSGNVVPDISGVGEPMDLTIGKPENVKWMPDCLRIFDAADLRHAGTAQKFKDAWKKSNGLTIEFWIRGPVDPDKNYAEQRRFTCLTIGKSFGHIWWNQAFEGDPTSRAIGHDAVVYLDEGKQACFDRSTGPLLTDVARRVILDSRPLALYNGPDPVVFHLAPSFEYGSKAKFPWKGDLVLVAIYGRPFTARELTDSRNRHPSALVPEFVETEEEPPLPAK